MTSRSVSYLGWLKQRITDVQSRPLSTRPINLAVSGVSTSLSRGWLNDMLTHRFRELADRLGSPHEFGLPALIDAIRSTYSLPPQRDVALTAGASGGLRLVMESFLAGQPGADVLVESPVYEPLLRLPLRYGTHVRPLPRFLEHEPDFASTIGRLVRPHTCLVILSNLHNPTGDHLTPEQLTAAVDVAKRNAPAVRFVLDETFLDLGPTPFATAATLDPCIITIGSLSKTYGLGDLRCGWVTAEPSAWPNLREDWVLFENLCSPVSEHLAAEAFHDLPKLLMAATAQLTQNRAILSDCLSRIAAYGFVAPQPVPDGSVIFVKLHMAIPTVELVDALAAEHGVLLAPGAFFGGDYGDCVRIGYGGDTEQLQQGLARLEAGLLSIGRRSTVT